MYLEVKHWDTKHKYQTVLRKKKKNRDQDEKDINFDSEIDLEAKKWAIGLEKKTPNYKNDKSRDHKEDY